MGRRVNIFSGNIFCSSGKRWIGWGKQMVRCGNFQNTVNTTVQTEFLNDKKTGWPNQSATSI
jgi:hypothetical protein